MVSLVLRRSISAEKPWALELLYGNGRGYRILCHVTETVALEIERAGPARFLRSRPENTPKDQDHA